MTSHFLIIRHGETEFNATRVIQTPDVPLSEFPLYTSSVTASYTFEINAGTAKRFNISIGDTVTFLNIDNPIAQC